MGILRHTRYYWVLLVKKKQLYNWKYNYLGYGPFPVTVTTRIIPILVGNPYEPLFATVAGKGPQPKCTTVLWDWKSGPIRRILCQILQPLILYTRKVSQLASENEWLEDYPPFGKVTFWGRAVKLWGCIPMYPKQITPKCIRNSMAWHPEKNKSFRSVPITGGIGSIESPNWQYIPLIYHL